MIGKTLLHRRFTLALQGDQLSQKGNAFSPAGFCRGDDLFGNFIHAILSHPKS
jgi:hypothetical protein